MNTEAIIGTILLRERYRRDDIYHAIRLSVGLAVVVTFMSVVACVLLLRGPVYKYVMVDPVGRIINMVPLEQPNMTDAAVLAWAVDSVTKVYTFDFANYRRQFQAAQTMLTQVGYYGFEKALRESGNFVAVRENRYVTTAVPNGPARMVASGPVTNALGETRWSWVVEFPMLITYRSSKQSTTQDLIAKVTLVRLPEYVNRAGIGIRQVIAE